MSKAEIGKNQLQALIAMGLRVNYDSAATWNTLNKCEIYQNLNEVSLQINGGNFCFISYFFFRLSLSKQSAVILTN